MFRGRRPRALILAGLLAAGGATVAPAAPQPVLQVGQLRLHSCGARAPWCASLGRHLDPTGVVSGEVPVYFEFYPHTAPGAAAGTLVATEGGPGYPATDSSADYLALYQPLRGDHDVLIVDNRGTGRSAAVNCPQLQSAPALTEADIGACGRSLGPAAPLYSSALAADDLAAVLDALGIARIDLYGDSYGTYFAQVFALRHPERLRSLILDGAYALDGPDYPWYPHFAPATRDKFDRACERDRDCRELGGSSLEHIAPALALLRREPFNARVRYGDGRLARFKANASQLAIVMFGGYPRRVTLRETDAAARAFSAGDRRPLLRLMAEVLSSTDSRYPLLTPQEFSAGLAAAVFCQDAPQIFDMSLAPAQRMRARDAAIARRRAQAPDTYAPFSIDEFRGMPIDYAFIDECVQWPAVSHDSPAVPLVPAGARYPDVPVLVLSGEFDGMTGPADGMAAAAHFAHGHHVMLANSLHVNALPRARSECGAIVARRFIAELTTGDESCATQVPPVRLLPQFARLTRELAPAHGLAGNQARDPQLRAATAALFTAEDLITRAQANGAGRGIGLRGGDFSVRPASQGYRLELREVRWTEDAAFSGAIDWPGRSGIVRAQLRLRGAHGSRGTLQLQWPEGVGGAVATVRGSLDGHALLAEAPAP